MDSYFSQMQQIEVKKKKNTLMDLFLSNMDWSGVDYCVVLDSHSDGTHSLQNIHCLDSNAMLHLSKSDEETNSSTSWMI